MEKLDDVKAKILQKYLILLNLIWKVLENINEDLSGKQYEPWAESSLSCFPILSVYRSGYDSSSLHIGCENIT